MVRWIRTRRQLTTAGREVMRAVVTDRLYTDTTLRQAVTIAFRDRITMARTRAPQVGRRPGVDLSQMIRMVMVSLVDNLDDGRMVTSEPGWFAHGQRRELAVLEQRLMNGVLAERVAERFVGHMDETRAAAIEDPTMFTAMVMEDLGNELREEWE